MSRAKMVPQGSRLQRWFGVLGPAAVLVWAASHQSWGWVAFSALTLGVGVALLFLSPPQQSQLRRWILWIAGAFFLCLSAVTLYFAVRWVTQDVAIGVVVLVMAVVFVTLGLLLLRPAQTMRVLHIQAGPSSATYRDAKLPAGPNDVLPS